ncbi:hypothetical protein M9458_030789, partial [Cirrhinus mrigala]
SQTLITTLKWRLSVPECRRTAFVNACYLRSEEERRRALGLDLETTALNLKDNGEL